MSIKEGRSKLSFPGYNSICEHLMKTKPQQKRNRWAEGIFGWVFMTLCWNLMSRGENVRSVMLKHFDWKNDCMTVTFAKHKGDATGEGLGNEKHVYANPLNPHICPILALAVLVFTYHRGEEVEMQTLFADGNSDDRFSKILAKIIKEIPENILGADPKEIGTHSNRKGSTTYALSFVIISAYLRMGGVGLLSKTAVVMQALRRIAESRHLLPAAQMVGDLTRDESDHIFNVCYAELLRDLYGPRRGSATDNVAKTMCPTLANKIYRKRKAAHLDDPSVVLSDVNTAL